MFHTRNAIKTYLEMAICVAIVVMIKTRGLEALTRMLFFKLAMIIIGLCANSEASKRNISENGE